jgi:phosphotransferase system  glucose/maltose/N-acetylglucosamine-specific IIC component
MVDWKTISRIFFIAAVIGFLYAAFTSFISMVAMYAPPDVMAQRSADEGKSTLLLFTGIAILFLAGIVSYFMEKKQEKEQPPEERDPF